MPAGAAVERGVVGEPVGVTAGTGTGVGGGLKSVGEAVGGVGSVGVAVGAGLKNVGEAVGGIGVVGAAVGGGMGRVGGGVGGVGSVGSAVGEGTWMVSGLEWVRAGVCLPEEGKSERWVRKNCSSACRMPTTVHGVRGTVSAMQRQCSHAPQKAT